MMTKWQRPGEVRTQVASCSTDITGEKKRWGREVDKYN